MPKVKVKTEFNIQLARKVTGDKIHSAIGAVGLDALGAMREELSKPGTGIEYPRGKDAVHIASAPGEPPAVDSGGLRQSASVEIFRTTNGAEAVVTVAKETALPLHFGTEKVKARPFADAPIRPDRLSRYLKILKRFL